MVRLWYRLKINQIGFSGKLSEEYERKVVNNLKIFDLINWINRGSIKFFLKWGPDQCSLVGWVSFHKTKGCWFHFLFRAHAWVVVGAHTRGNRLIFLSHFDVSLPFLLSPFSLYKWINKIFFFKVNTSGKVDFWEVEKGNSEFSLGHFSLRNY